MVEPLYIKEAFYVIFIHAKFKNYSRTELLFSLANHLNGSFFYFVKEAKVSKAILDKNEDRKQISLSNNKLTEFGNCSQVALKGSGFKRIPKIYKTVEKVLVRMRVHSNIMAECGSEKNDGQ